MNGLREPDSRPAHAGRLKTSSPLGGRERHGTEASRRTAAGRLTMKVQAWLLLVLFVALIGLGPEVSAGQGLPILGRHSIPDPLLVERHSQALVHWVEKGFQGSSLIHIDAHDDLRRIPEQRISRLRRIYRNKDLQALRQAEGAGDSGIYHAGSFLYAAYRLGIIDKTYWIIPYPYFSGADPEAGLRSFLRHCSFPQEDIRRFKLQGHAFSGKIHGHELHICPPEHLPDVDEPVLISLDADFFPALDTTMRNGLLRAWRSFCTDLFSQGYRVRDVHVAHSVDGGFLEPVKRWVGCQSREVITSPELLVHPAPLLWTLRDRANTFYEQGKPDRLAQTCRTGLARFPGEPSLTLYLAFAQLAQGHIDQAFCLAADLCRKEPGFCPGLADLGQCLLDRGELEAGLRFFERAYALNPGLNYRQTEVAHALRRAGRFEDALDYYESCRRKNGSFPTDFLLGETCLHLGRDKQALRHFDRGRRALARELYPILRDECDVEAVRSAIATYERMGLLKKARELRRHPRLIKALNRFD